MAVLQVVVRKDTAANWTTVNPTLLEGETGYETDTTWHKIGDGATAWTSLAYYHGPPWIQVIDGGSPTSTFAGTPDFAGSLHGVMATDGA